MGYDPFSPISAAKVNVLCIPASRITSTKFDEFMRAFQAFDVVSLKNVAGSGSTSPSASSFSAYRDGSVLLSISKEVLTDELTGPDKFEVNARPQIILGLVDGESLHSPIDGEPQQSLESIFDAFRQSLLAFDYSVVECFIVLGGKQLPTTDESYFVDLEGDGPSLLDVISQVVARFQTRLQSTVSGLQTESQALSVQTAQSQTSTNVAERASQQNKRLTNTTDHASVRAGQAVSNGTQDNDRSVEIAVKIGQLSLQAGHWPQALHYLSDGASNARSQNSFLLHAKALEGLLVCMLLLAWAHLDFNIPQICYPTSEKRSSIYNAASTSALVAANRAASDYLATGRSISSANTLTQLIPYLINTIISLYEQAASTMEDSVSFQLACESRIRWTNLLLTIKTHGSNLQDAALRSLVEKDDTEIGLKSQQALTPALNLHTKTLTKMLIDSAMEAQSRLTVQQAAPIQIAAALGLSILGVERKQAFSLREFLQKLGPVLIEARRAGAAEVGVHPAASLSPLNSVGDFSGGVVKNGIRSLLDSVCSIYGLPQAISGTSSPTLQPEARLQKALHAWSCAHQNGDVMMKIDILSLCVEVSDAVPDLQCSLDLMSQLLQISMNKATLRFPVSDHVSLISANEQSRLLTNIKRTANTAARYGIHNARATYWDRCLVRAIEVSEEPNSSRLMPHTARDLSLATDTKNEIKRDPFIFNPFAKAKPGAGKSVVVVGEQVRFSVVLQNPLQVDVEIEDIFLWTEGCDFMPDHHSIVLGPLCSQTFMLSGKAHTEGTLTIVGCKATIRGCYQEDFLIVSGDWKITRQAKRMATTTKIESKPDTALPQLSRLSLQVTRPLPSLIVESTSLVQQSLMLLEGESTDLRLTLRNGSDLNVDFLLVTFQDSVTRRLEEALNNKDLMPADLYEIQNQIATRPIVRWKVSKAAREDVSIKAGTTADFVVEIFGRPGLTEVAILVDYAHLGKSKEAMNGSFFTRQLRHTLTTTINGSIDIPRCSIMSLESGLGWAYRSVGLQEDNRDRLFSSLGTRAGDDGLCMLLLDVRNIWPQPLEAHFETSLVIKEFGQDSGIEAGRYMTSETLQPGQMTRVLLLIPQILITDPYAPIPSLDTKRQFVVSASKMSIEAEAASRESFWYRERLLSCLRATWKEQGTNRSGQLDMRKGVRLSSRMIDALRIEFVEILFSLRPTASRNERDQVGTEPVLQIGESHYRLVRNSFARLVIKIRNRSNEDLRLLLRLQPSLRNQAHNIALDLSKRLAWSGVLQRALHPPLKAGESREVELSIIALAEGEYEFNGTVEEIQGRPARTGVAALELGSGVERRIWHSRKACLIDAVQEAMS